MLNELPKYMAVSLILTLIIECSMAWALKVRDKRDMLNVALVNVFTNPLVVCFAFLAGFFYGGDARIGATVYLELFAFVSEALIYRKTLSFRRLNPFLLSLILNATSYLSGLVINKIIY